MAFETTKEFIEKLFSTQVLDFELGKGCNENDNVGGSLISIKATTTTTSDKDGKNKKIHALVKKFPDKESPFYEQVKEGEIFKTEAVVYNVLAPKLESFVKSKGGEYSVPLPKIYGNFHDDENDFICLEDLRPEGYRMSSVFKGLTFEETSLVLKELAKFHSFTYAVIRHEGEQLFDVKGGGVLEKLNSRRHGAYAKARKELYHQLFETAIGVAANNLELMGKPSLASKLKARVPPGSAGELLDSLTDAVDTTLFPCVIHGDCWTNNFLLKYDSDGKPLQVKFIDFQLTRRGNILEELEYFLLTSTTPELRRQYLTQLLGIYFLEFKGALESINVPLPISFREERLRADFNFYLNWGLMYMCFAIPLQMGSAEEEEKSPTTDAGGPESNNCGAVIGASLKSLMKGSLAARERLAAVAEEILNHETSTN